MLLACTKTQDTFINNCCTTNVPNGAVSYGFGENRFDLEKSGLLLEKKKLNHHLVQDFLLAIPDFFLVTELTYCVEQCTERSALASC